MKRLWLKLASLFGALSVLVPGLVYAAGGKAETLVVVADKRMVSSPVTVYFLDLYNTDPFMFGLVCTIITAFLGCALGLLTDFIMKRTGIDLTSRKIVEH